MHRTRTVSRCRSATYHGGAPLEFQGRGDGHLAGKTVPRPIEILLSCPEALSRDAAGGYCQVNSQRPQLRSAGLPSDRDRQVPGRKGGLPQRPVVARCHRVAAQVEEVPDCSVDADESLRLKRGFEPPHSPLSDPDRLVRQLGPVVRVPTGIVGSRWQQPAAGYRVACEPVRHDRPRLTAEARQYVPEEAPGRRRVPPLLEQQVDHPTVLIDGPPQVPVLAPDPDEDLVHEGGIAVAAVPTPQSMRVPGPELVAPETDRFVADEDAPPSQEILESRWLRLKRWYSQIACWMISGGDRCRR
jgi:hypothetical protein